MINVRNIKIDTLAGSDWLLRESILDFYLSSMVLKDRLGDHIEEGWLIVWQQEVIIDGGRRLEDCFRNRCNRQKHFRNFNIDGNKNYFRIINLQILSQKLLNILSCSTDGYILGSTPCLTDCRGPTIITFAPASTTSTDSTVSMMWSRHGIQRFWRDSRGPTTQSTPANRTTPVLMPILIGSTIGSTTFCSRF